MNHEFWYLSRAAGFTAYALLFASVAVGMASNMKLAGRTIPRAVTFETHRVISLLALAFTLLHVYVLLGDPYFNFTVGELSWPFLSPYRTWQVAVGIFAFWTLVILVVSFYARQWIGAKAWRAIHYAAFALYGLATLHGITAGTDSRSPWAAAMYLGSGLIVLTLVFYRVQLVQPERRVARLARLAPAVVAVLVASAAFAGAMVGNGAVGNAGNAASSTSNIVSPVDPGLGVDDTIQYEEYDEDDRYEDDDAWEDGHGDDRDHDEGEHEDDDGEFDDDA